MIQNALKSMTMIKILIFNINPKRQGSNYKHGRNSRFSSSLFFSDEEKLHEWMLAFVSNSLQKTKVIFDPADHDLPVRKKKAPESGSTAPTAAGPSSSLAASSPGFPMANAFLNQHLRIQQLPQKAPRQLVQQQQQQEQQPQLQQRQHQHQLPQQVQVQHHHQHHQQHQHHHQQQQLGSLVLQKIVKSESAGPLTKGASGGIGGGAKPGSASSGLAPAMATVTPLGAVVPAAGVGQSGPVCPRCRSGKPKVRGNQRIERLLRCSSCSVVGKYLLNCEIYAEIYRCKSCPWPSIAINKSDGQFFVSIDARVFEWSLECCSSAPQLFGLLGQPYQEDLQERNGLAVFQLQGVLRVQRAQRQGGVVFLGNFFNYFAQICVFLNDMLHKNVTDQSLVNLDGF